MTITELRALVPLVQKYTEKGWDFEHLSSASGVPLEHCDHAYEVKSPRMREPATIYYSFDEFQLLSFESLSVARQTHGKQVAAVLSEVAEDILKEIAAVYALPPGKNASIPEYVTIKELRIPLFEEKS